MELLTIKLTIIIITKVVCLSLTEKESCKNIDKIIRNVAKETINEILNLVRNYLTNKYNGKGKS